MNKQKSNHILDTTLDLLINQGYQAFSMIQVAKSAGVSKETLYRYYGNKQGLLIALVKRKSETAEVFKPYFDLYPEDLRACLCHIGEDLLSLVLSQPAISINRLVISLAGTDNELAHLLEKHGRQVVIAHLKGELEKYPMLEKSTLAKVLPVFFALLIRDAQLNAITNLAPPLDKKAIKAQAKEATDYFLQLNLFAIERSL